MYNKILWSIDNECDGKTFERLCTDLMYREGYKDIIPIGGNYDNGRDAEIRKLKGRNEISEVTFFQYSLEKDWLKKFEREIENTFNKHDNITTYVFVTNSKVTGNKRDELSEQFSKKYRTNLRFYDREWLRTRLEIASIDLAKKYFQISTDELEIENYDIEVQVPQDQIKEIAWKYYKTENYEPAIFAFKELLLTNPNHPQILQALSWALYLTYRYDEAIFYINKAIDALGHTYNTMVIKACIMAEYGIKKNSRPYLLSAKEIFSKLSKDVNRAIDHYNLGNTLSALCEFEEARKEYLLSIKQNPKRAETWKNLGSVYDHLGNHSEELKCYDKALEISPSLPQAMVSKAITILKHKNKPGQAIRLIDKALLIDEEIYIKWPLIYYWIAEALNKLNKTELAIEKINAGLNHTPDNVYMLNLKANILSKLWIKNSAYIESAILFYKHLLSTYQYDREATIELLRIYNHTNNEDDYWKLVIDHFHLESLNPQKYFNRSEFFKKIEKIVFYYIPYNEYRNTFNIDKHLEGLEEQTFLITNELKEILKFCYAFTFSTIQLYFGNKFILKKKTTNFKEHMQNITDDLIQIIEVLSNYCMNNFQLKTQKDKVSFISFNMAHWPIYSILETSSQFGYLMGRLNVSVDEANKIRKQIENNLDKIHKKIMLSVLEKMNKKLQLLKK